MIKTFTLAFIKACLLFIFFIPYSSFAQPAIGTTGFDNNVGTLAATGVSPQTGTVDGYSFTLYSGGNAEITNLTSQVNLTTTPTGSGVWQFTAIEASDLSSFKLDQLRFKVLSTPFIGKNLSVTGYKNGLAVSGAFTISPTITALNTTYSVDLSSISGFFNVDEFRLQPSGFNAQGTLAIEDITVQPAVVLPVKWLSFDVRNEKGFHLLNWTTTSEINHAYFEVEQSSNAKDYYTVGKVIMGTQAGSINTWTFKYPESNRVVFYRVRQVDKDGRAQYSGTRKAGENIEANIVLFPNPAVNFVQIKGVAAGTAVQVSDAGGRSVGYFQLDAQQKINISKLPPGRYAVSFDLASGKQVKWIIKD
ncbi:MAG: T9SS type A sorting domain-containing protein [Gloeobacteraceae cyanobacterium ES-bin-316]|nr:T9SS type A sorting domain-containing protein [Ferruginibacter sp.]